MPHYAWDAHLDLPLILFWHFMTLFLQPTAQRGQRRRFSDDFFGVFIKYWYTKLYIYSHLHATTHTIQNSQDWSPRQSRLEPQTVMIGAQNSQDWSLKQSRLEPQWHLTRPEKAHNQHEKQCSRAFFLIKNTSEKCAGECQTASRLILFYPTPHHGNPLSAVPKQQFCGTDKPSPCQRHVCHKTRINRVILSKTTNLMLNRC